MSCFECIAFQGIPITYQLLMCPAVLGKFPITNRLLMCPTVLGKKKQDIPKLKMEHESEMQRYKTEKNKMETKLQAMTQEVTERRLQ